MEVQIFPLDESKIDDWLDFFDSRAFSDHKEWKTCYCTFYHYPKLSEYDSSSNRKRDYAVWLIRNNILKGYLAYKEGRVIAFCNVNDIENYSKLSNLPKRDAKILAIVCFIVQKEERRKGFAGQILKKIIEDAKLKGFDEIEAYPGKEGESSEYSNFHGPRDLYIKMGFSEDRVGRSSVVRKILN